MDERRVTKFGMRGYVLTKCVPRLPRCFPHNVSGSHEAERGCAMEKWRRCGQVEFGGTGNARVSRRGYERCINASGDSDQIDADTFSP